MAVTTALSRNVRRMGLLIRQYAADAGVDRDHLAIAGILNRKTERIYLSVGTDQPIDHSEWYVGIQKALGQECGRIPSVAHLGIVVRQVDDLDTIYERMTVDDDSLDLTDML